MHARIDAAKHFRCSATIWTNDLYRFCRQHSDPKVNDSASDNKQETDDHRECHNDGRLLEKNSDVHNEYTDENKSKSERSNFIDFVCIF